MSKPKLDTDSWPTPQWLFDELNAKFGPFDIDVCASDENKKCAAYFDREMNALSLEWVRPVPYIYDSPTTYRSRVEFDVIPAKCWMNPPYSDPYPWIKKASEEAANGCTVVALVNYDHTTAWWKEFIEDPANGYKPYPGVEIDKQPKRIKFDAPQWFIDAGGKVTTNTRPTVAVVFRPV